MFDVSRPGTSGTEARRFPMTGRFTRVRVLQLAILLTAGFDLMALVVLARNRPIAFAIFMFLGQPLFLAALLILGAAVLADLRAKDLL
jgi:hypothetical protein